MNTHKRKKINHFHFINIINLYTNKNKFGDVNKQVNFKS